MGSSLLGIVADVSDRRVDAAHYLPDEGCQGRAAALGRDLLRPAEAPLYAAVRQRELDLSGLDFSTAPGPVTVDVSVDAGNLEIVVPPDVDVVLVGNINLGNADVFDQSWGGIDPGEHTVTDNDIDGTGGGELRINASVDLGNLEVHR